MIHLKNVIVFTVKYSRSRVKRHAAFVYLKMLTDMKKITENIEN